MKKLLLLLLLIFLPAIARSQANVGGATLGETYEETYNCLVDRHGIPQYQRNNFIKYSGIVIGGIFYENAYFFYEYFEGAQRLTNVYLDSFSFSNEKYANRDLERIAKRYQDKYDLSSVVLDTGFNCYYTTNKQGSDEIKLIIFVNCTDEYRVRVSYEFMSPKRNNDDF